MWESWSGAGMSERQMNSGLGASGGPPAGSVARQITNFDAGSHGGIFRTAAVATGYAAFADQAGCMGEESRGQAEGEKEREQGAKEKPAAEGCDGDGLGNAGHGCELRSGAGKNRWFRTAEIFVTRVLGLDQA